MFSFCYSVCVLFSCNLPPWVLCQWLLNTDGLVVHVWEVRYARTWVASRRVPPAAQWIGQRGKTRARGAAGVKTRWAAFQRSNGRGVMYWKLKPFQVDILMGYWKLKTCLGGTYFHGSGKGKGIDGNIMQLWAWSGLGSSAGGAAGDFAIRGRKRGGRKWDTTQSHGSGL